MNNLRPRPRRRRRRLRRLRRRADRRAISAAAVALVDHGPLGGLCILRGCMPSKAFLASSDAAQDAREAGPLGVHAGGVTVDMPFILRRKRELVKEFADYRIEGIAKFPLYSGRATFVSSTELQVGDDTILRADNFIIATGSVVQPALVPGLAETGFLDTDTALELEHVPDSAIVLGGGYTACELGQFLSRMGARTTMLDSQRALAHQPGRRHRRRADGLLPR